MHPTNSAVNSSFYLKVLCNILHISSVSYRCLLLKSYFSDLHGSVDSKFSLSTTVTQMCSFLFSKQSWTPEDGKPHDVLS